MWKYPRLFVGNQEFKQLNVTQGNHYDPLWSGNNSIDLGWGTFGSPEAFCNSPVYTPDTDIKYTQLYWDGVGTKSYLVFTFQGTQGWFEVLLAHQENYGGALWQVKKKGEQICTPAYKTVGGQHIHIVVRLNGQEFDTMEFIKNEWIEEEKPECKEDYYKDLAKDLDNKLQEQKQISLDLSTTHDALQDKLGVTLKELSDLRALQLDTEARLEEMRVRASNQSEELKKKEKAIENLKKGIDWSAVNESELINALTQKWVKRLGITYKE
jgi:phage terminase small subunit